MVSRHFLLWGVLHQKFSTPQLPIPPQKHKSPVIENDILSYQDLSPCNSHPQYKGQMPAACVTSEASKIRWQFSTHLPKLQAPSASRARPCFCRWPASNKLWCQELSLFKNVVANLGLLTINPFPRVFEIECGIVWALALHGQ